jgi:beta-aspartyl-peptidase (threonine type)
MRLKPALIVHGGAGNIPAEGIGTSREGIRRALDAGWRILCDGGGALDAVEAAIVVLEDDPAFDAGLGSHLNLEGRAQLDAIIMDGGTLKAGAVAAVERVRNPIRLARRILEGSEHMMLVGAGAEKFASENGMALCAPEELVSEHAREVWRRCLATSQVTEGGTVGAVARDSMGNLFAGTSTGGTRCKYPGRVGDSPLIGCGCYADIDAGGVSCTGHGEGIMKIVMAKTAVDLLRDPQALKVYRRSAAACGPLREIAAAPPQQDLISVAPADAGTTIAQAVADAAVFKLAHRAHSRGGLILLDSDGRPAAAFNTPDMSYGYVEADASFRIFP